MHDILDCFPQIMFAQKEIILKATVSMYEVLKLGRKHNLSIKCLLSLFDKMVKPILLYGYEIWGSGNKL
jgi:hypothetical protein